MKCKILWLQSFGVYYLQSWFGSFLLFMIGRLFKVLSMLTCMQEVGHSDQWLVSVIFLSAFGFGLEFPVRPSLYEFGIFYGCCSRINGSIFHNFVWQVNMRLIAVGNFRFVFIMCESTVFHPASRNGNICCQSGHIQLKNFQLFKMSWS